MCGGTTDTTGARCVARCSSYRTRPRQATTSADLQALQDTGATGFEPATSGVTGRIRWYSGEPEPTAQYRYCRGLSLRTSTLFLEFHGAASLFPPHLYPIAASPISQTPSAVTRRFNDYGRQTSDSETDSLSSCAGFATFEVDRCRFRSTVRLSAQASSAQAHDRPTGWSVWAMIGPKADSACCATV